MKVTTKGRVTIPHAIREQLGLLPGAEVEFRIDGDAIRVTRVRESSLDGKEMVDRMRGKAVGNVDEARSASTTGR